MNLLWGYILLYSGGKHPWPYDWYGLILVGPIVGGIIYLTINNGFGLNRKLFGYMVMVAFFIDMAIHYLGKLITY